MRAGFDGSALLEVGIGCEACHGGAREHARDPRVRPSFVPVAPWLDVAPPRARGSRRVAAPAPRPTDAQAINRACARCHQVLFSRYPFTWEGGRRDATAGGSHINSGEARDFLLGGCAGAMACTACHDPHGADAGEQRSARSRRPRATRPAPDATPSSPIAQRLKEHAHHDPDGAGGSCVACHMPRKNMGLDGTLTRYHRIGSPTDAARVLGDRPLECALCHADRSVGSLVDAMERWWPVRYPRQRLEELYGSLDANVMRATLELGKPHEQAVAMATLGAARDRAAAPLLARQLARRLPARARVGEARADVDPGPLRRRPGGRRRDDRAASRVVRRADPDRRSDSPARARGGRGPGGLTMTPARDPRLVPHRPLAADAPRPRRRAGAPVARRPGRRGVVRDARAPGGAIGAAVVGLALVASGAGLTLAGMFRILRDDAYLAIRTDGVLFRSPSRETLLSGTTSRGRAGTQAQVELVLERMEGEAVVVARRFARIAGPALAEKLEQARRARRWACST